MGTFFKSFWSRMGRNSANRVSNAVYGDKWGTPYRVGVNQGAGGTKRSAPAGADNRDCAFMSGAAADRTRRVETIYDAIARVNSIPIPHFENEIVSLLHTLSINFSSASASGCRDREQKTALRQLRQAIYRKYSEALTALEAWFPHDPLEWSFFLGKWRMFFSRRPWNWVWVVYGTVLASGTYNAISFGRRDDIVFVSVLWAVPVAWAAWVLIARASRLGR